MKLTVRRRGEQWNWQFPVWRNGKRHFVSGTESSRSDAQRVGAAQMAEYDQGRPVASDKRVTLASYLTDRWLPAVETDLRRSTWRGYENIFAVRVIPRIGQVRLCDLDAGTIEALRGELLREGGRGARGLSPQSVKNTLNALSRALGDGEEWGLIARNPVRRKRRTGARHGDGPRQEMRTWSGEQVRAFLTATADDHLAIAYHLALLTGMRRGELLGLEWRDLDLERRQLAVRRAVVAAGYEVTEGEPKSGRARTIKLGPETVAALRKHRRCQLEQHVAIGRPRPTRVITREDGTALHPQSLTYRFDQAVKTSGLPRIRFHDLRHSSASLMLEAGVHPKVVQERLGHSSISITLDLYSHVVPGMQEDAASRLGSLVFGL